MLAFRQATYRSRQNDKSFFPCGWMYLTYFLQVLLGFENSTLPLPYNLTVRARVDLIVVAPRKNVFFHNSPKVVVGHGLKDYGVKNLFTM